MKDKRGGGRGRKMKSMVKKEHMIPQDSGVRWAAKGPTCSPSTLNFTFQNAQALVNIVHNTILYIKSC